MTDSSARDAMCGRIDGEIRRRRRARPEAESRAHGAVDREFLDEVLGVQVTAAGAASMLSRWRRHGIPIQHLVKLVRWSQPPPSEVVGLLAEILGCSADSTDALIRIPGIERVLSTWGRPQEPLDEELKYLFGYARG